MSLSEVATTGNRLATLCSLRDLLAETISTAEQARDVAALSRQLTDVLTQIEAAEKAAPEQKGTALDELNARRAARQSGPPGRSRTTG